VVGGSAAAGAFFLEIEFEELRAHALDLLFDFGAHIECPDDRTEAARRADGGQSCHAGADHHDLGGWHFARGGNLAGEEAPEVLSRFDHRAIAGNVRH
jgi:hypothetical protein